jgi:hypothetical protein
MLRALVAAVLPMNGRDVLSTLMLTSDFLLHWEQIRLM